MRRRGVFFRSAAVVIDVFRTLPELVPLIWIYSVGPLIFNFTITAPGAGILALTLWGGANLAEIYRAGVEAVPRGQYEAARSLGIPGFWMWSVIIAPQAVRMMTPPFVNFGCDLVKGSSLLSAIGVAELAYQATVIQRRDVPLSRDLHGCGSVLLHHHISDEPVCARAREDAERSPGVNPAVVHRRA